MSSALSSDCCVLHGQISWFLDLNLPAMDGKQVLSAVKSDLRLRRIPVVILSSPSDQQDIRSSYENYANSYITKTDSFDRMVDFAKTLEAFWFKLAALPDRKRDQNS